MVFSRQPAGQHGLHGHAPVKTVPHAIDGFVKMTEQFIRNVWVTELPVRRTFVFFLFRDFFRFVYPDYLPAFSFCFKLCNRLSPFHGIKLSISSIHFHQLYIPLTTLRRCLVFHLFQNSLKSLEVGKLTKMKMCFVQQIPNLCPM